MAANGSLIFDTQINTDGVSKGIASIEKANAKKLADQQEKDLQLLKDGWENLEHEYAVSSTMTESELYEKKKALWNEYGDASLKDHWSYLEDITKYDKNFAEEQIKLAQQEADEKQKIQDEENKKAENERKASLDEQNKIVDDGLSAIIKRYRQAYDDLEQKRKAYRDKLMAIGGDLFSVEEIEQPDGSKTKQYTVNNVDEQLRKMREYHASIKKLRAEGMSDLMLSDITSMNDEDSMQFAKYLSGMSSAEFAQINELYNEKQKLADELANDLYKDDAQLISDSMTSALADLASSSYEYGAQSAFEFARGFNESLQELGVSGLYQQLQASGASRKYENYQTVQESKLNPVFDILPGKTVLVIGDRIIGEASTVYQVKQNKIKGT